MRLREARRDLYRRLAREQGYKSRAAFKLIEANERYRFLRPGGRVLDFGSSPGGWLQVASELVGPQGRVVGVDIAPIRAKEKNVVALKMDVMDQAFPGRAIDLLGGKADVFLSDLAPTVSGVWELDQGRQINLTLRVVGLAQLLLRPDGCLFCKLFEGEGSRSVREEFRRWFSTVRVIKPAASRSASSELYYFCDGFNASRE